jgi:hypothetical protein
MLCAIGFEFVGKYIDKMIKIYYNEKKEKK